MRQLLSFSLTPNQLKGISLSFELMYSRPIFGVGLEEQHFILNRLADLADAKVIVPRVTKHFDHMKHLAEAHKLQETGTIIGKTVLTANFD
jgi:NADPH:quinone reductase-like Zn-dependent oxidoreductase